MKELEYVTFTCRNKKCGRGFVDIDLYNTQNYPSTYKYCDSCVEEGFKNLKFYRFIVPVSLREKEFNGIDIDYFILLINIKLQSDLDLRPLATNLLKQSVTYFERDVLKNKRISRKNYDTCFNMAVERINHFKNSSPETLLQAS